MTAIEFSNISKQYSLGVVSNKTLCRDVLYWWTVNVLHKEVPCLDKGDFTSNLPAKTFNYVWALRNIDFKVEQGEIIGIVGKNGAGKSTLLKMLSKIVAPTTGCIYTSGRVGSLLEVGTGFHYELTGRENIYMNGAILGMSKREISQKLDEIIDFSGCELYIDTPVKRYSQGMIVRLGFSVAAHLNPDILVVDEVLAIGDSEFPRKAVNKLKEINQQGVTILYVSHNMETMLSLCKTGILLENGTITHKGNIQDIVALYKSH